MSGLDILRSFAESHEHDAVMIRGGINYGNVRDVLRRIAELEAALQACRDLMAVVHRDGGDYRQTHGDRQAADDAIAIVYKLRAALDAARERREAAEAVLSWLDMRGGLGYEKHGRIAAHFARYEKAPT